MSLSISNFQMLQGLAPWRPQIEGTNLYIMKEARAQGKRMCRHLAISAASFDDVGRRENEKDTSIIRL